MSNIIEFPRVNGAVASGRTMPGITTPELRDRAIMNFYTAERRSGVDAWTAYDRSQAFGADLERIARIMSEG